LGNGRVNDSGNNLRLVPMAWRGQMYPSLMELELMPVARRQQYQVQELERVMPTNGSQILATTWGRNQERQ